MRLLSRAIYAVLLGILMGPAGVAAKSPVIAIESRGANCPENEACSSSVTLYDDGSCEGGSEDACPTTLLPAQNVTQLQTAVNNADYSTMRMHKYTGICPSSVPHGKELIYHFYTANGPQDISACQYLIDFTHEPFRTLFTLSPK